MAQRLKKMTVRKAVCGRKSEKEIFCPCGCGKKFQVGTSHRKYYHHPTCSRRYYLKQIAAGEMQPDTTRTCECGKEFLVYYKMDKDKKYCDEKCKKKYCDCTSSKEQHRDKSIKNRDEHCFRKLAPFDTRACAKYQQCGFRKCSGYEPEQKKDLYAGYQSGFSGVTFGRII
jgi:hypothetical protein